MTKRTRLIILLFCTICFFIIAPILVAYSMGYRFNFERMKITETGGIYVRTFPAAEKIIVDSKITEKPGVFSNSIFVQSLLPADHTVLVQKNGYHDYLKTITVLQEQVTKLENIILFKKDILFKIVTDKTNPFNIQERFIIKNNNLYYSNVPENSGVSVSLKTVPVLKKISAFTIQNNNIIWLGTNGFLYKSDLLNLVNANPIKITLTPLKMTKTDAYKIIVDNKNIFLKNNGNLLIFNDRTNNLDNFYKNIKDIKISPDGKNIIYYDDHNIYMSLIPSPAPKDAPAENVEKIILHKSNDIINDCLWINNDYIIFTAGDNIIISEIDIRGNINTIILPQTIVIAPEKKIEIKKPQIIFGQQEEKLYILINDTLLISEKLIP